MMAIRTKSHFIVLLLLFPYLLNYFGAHANLIQDDNGGSRSNASSSVPLSSSPVKGIYTEGGAIPATSLIEGAPTQQQVHASVKKRILSDPPGNASAATLEKPSVGNITSTSTTASPVNNSSSGTSQNQAEIDHNKSGNATTNSSSPALPSSNKTEPISTSSSSSSTTTTTTSTTTTTTSTTPKPKKPTATVSLDDDQTIVHVPSVKSSYPPRMHSSLAVEEPIVQFSMEEPDRSRRSRDLVIPVVSLIFAVPMLLGLITVVVRRFREFWHTRHYRRMDFLVDGIYND